MTADGSSIISKCFAGGVGCGFAGFLTNPFYVIKVRNQQYADTKYSTFRSTAISIFKEESALGFFKGATASVLRECTYSALRMGLYEPIKSQYSILLNDKFDIPPSSPIVKILSSFTSGTIGSSLFNPIDVVKVRFQSAGPNKPTPYSSIPNAFYTIYIEKGFSGLYIGTTATVTRAAFLTSAELGSYDIMKNNILVPMLGFDKEGNNTHFIASFIASLLACTVANPADCVKTRVMNDPNGIVGGASAHFKDILKKDGPMGFMRGW
eukprot:CAMPEP_0170834060 /NCGR_PEP_ID=MMETSP0734-20130129/720_1 /TAXON_ID=186038 /ORGANISM="Fragilariopsis kerguelensis, Strain L26-C5" /LENGTH=265 /DNA_ID=CAMNT_0011200531 /DNA_START=193 /DNA_END=987 /DNA_ORIENTATION=+